MSASKIEELRQITYTALKHCAMAASFAQQSLQSLQVSLDNLRIDINGYFDREDTYDEHCSVWDSLLHVASMLDELQGLCSTASSEAKMAAARAASTEKGLSVEMAAVAQGLSALSSRLDVLEDAGVSSVGGQPVSCLQQLLAPSAGSNDEGVQSVVSLSELAIHVAELRSSVSSLQTTVAAHESTIQEQRLSLTTQQNLVTLMEQRLVAIETTARELRADIDKDPHHDQLHQFSLIDKAGLTALLVSEEFDLPRLAVFCDMISLLAYATDQYKLVHELGQRLKLFLTVALPISLVRKPSFHLNASTLQGSRVTTTAWSRMVILSPSSNPRKYGLALTIGLEPTQNILTLLILRQSVPLHISCATLRRALFVRCVWKWFESRSVLT
jgi:hypothetical protein